MWRFSLAVIALMSPVIGIISEEDAFRQYERDRGRSYGSPSERSFRFEIFRKNLALVNEREDSAMARLKGQVLLGASLIPRMSYTKTLNEFADLSDEEFGRFYLLPANILYGGRNRLLSGTQENARQEQADNSNDAESNSKFSEFPIFPGIPRSRQLQQNFGLPNRVDWSQFATPIKNQMKCNSCYAFAATGLVETWHRKLKNNVISLAEQELLDCSTQNQDCVGGQPAWALDYIIKNRIAYSTNYPYVAKKNPNCKAKTGRLLQFYPRPTVRYPYYSPYTFPFRPTAPYFPPRTPYYPPTNPFTPVRPPTTVPVASNRYSGIKGYRQLPQNIVGVLRELAKGPVVVAMYVSNAFKFYNNGVFNGDGCSDSAQANHAIVALAYDLTAEVPYILFKNSWGADWGDKGYFKVAIGQLSSSAKGLCLIANTPFGVTPNF